ncbi:MAG: HD domain-containing protein [Candidatus Sungbacteria bacterium]|uniref:HD domain-containing protein n=1 Tax=Candidatus Sungiibacteriota bacterium TaxID=2750080 RepID=A0A931YDS9_9BACT|nr:HD domain-containing protein [Candidatus Sungbacteria bacterium]
MKIPDHIKNILSQLEKAGYEAYLVGGCVRDLLMDRTPFDWDITTSAKPEEIQEVFSDSVYENDFGTVGIKIRHSESETEIVEVTPYRKEESYSDKRHPDKVTFTSNIEDDLARRDFTVNALAMDSEGKIIDPFGGEKDIKLKIIRAVGEPEKRFGEDALRLMRAARLAAQLGFEIEPTTKSAVKKHAPALKMIAHERVRDELMKLVASADPEKGIILMQELGLLKIVLPEVEEGVNVAQNKHHIYNVFEHSVKSLGFAAKYNFNVYVRWASLLHDVGKPRAKEGSGPEASFHGHEFIGAKMVARALERLKFSKDFIEKVYTLVRYHMFYYNVGEVTERSVRRLVRKVGPENMAELLELRQSERKGSGVPKAEPYKLRHLKYMIDKVSRDPLTVGMLKVNGHDVMRTLGLEPGPKVGYILNALLEEVIDKPVRNDRERLLARMKELNQLPISELIKLAESGQEKLEGEREREDEGIKGKYYV